MQETQNSENQFQDDDDELTLLMNSFVEKGTGIKNATDTFDAFIAAPPYNLADAMKAFLDNKSSDILYALRRYDIENVPYENTARLMLACVYIKPDILQLYGSFLDENYKEKAVPNPEDVIQPLSPTEKTDTAKVREFNEKVAAFKKDLAVINQYNNKISEIKNVVKQYGTVAKMGNEQLDVEGLPYVYFRFAVNEREDYTTAFIKEAWVIAEGLMQTVAKATITDVRVSELSDEQESLQQDSTLSIGNQSVSVKPVTNIKIESESSNDEYGIYDVSGHKDVKFYFSTSEEAQNFEQNKELIDQLYDKYKRYYRER